MHRRFAEKLNQLLEKQFPERRIFLRSDTDTRFIRLKPKSQCFAFLGASAVVAWAIIATAVLVMDSIGAGNFREQAKRDQRTYEMRLNALEAERDKRAEEALAAHNRFGAALEQISVMQTQLLDSETRRIELKTGIEVVQRTLRRTMKARETAEHDKQLLSQAIENSEDNPLLSQNETSGDQGMIDALGLALAQTAKERDKVIADAQEAFVRANEMETQIQLMQDKNDQIFRQLEEAMMISVEPLEKMFSAAGMDTDRMIKTVRSAYSGQGGPSLPIRFSTRGTEPSLDESRANGILKQMDELNLYLLAAQKAPFDMPIKAAYRFTSGFGLRWGRMHNGADFAGAHGTPIYSTADGVVIDAGWSAGYGRLIKIKHEFGTETRYAHLSKIRVKEGQRVSRGERIGDMGNTGRSTGTHLHYEIRINGKAINPMIYIKAARNVF